MDNHLPLHLLHGPFLLLVLPILSRQHRHLRRPHGLRLHLRRVHHGASMGTNQRQSRKKVNSSDWNSWSRVLYYVIWIFALAGVGHCCEDLCGVAKSEFGGSGDFCWGVGS